MVDYYFVGPSGHKIERDNYPVGSIILPPARRGDIENLLNNEPSRIVLVDGVFDQQPAIGHREIYEAITLGWEVLGLSSMGAIRAYEMRNYGMKGIGHVYNMFVENPELTDDEVALHHIPNPIYTPITEALVNIRFIFNFFSDRHGISSEEGNIVVDKLKKFWFGDRTISQIENVMLEVDISPDKIKCFLGLIENNRVKEIDLMNFLNTKD